MNLRAVLSSMHPEWSHASWIEVNMKHCFFRSGECRNHYYTFGIIGYSDGSKKSVNGAA